MCFDVSGRCSRLPFSSTAVAIGEGEHAQAALGHGVVLVENALTIQLE